MFPRPHSEKVQYIGTMFYICSAALPDCDSSDAASVLKQADGLLTKYQVCIYVYDGICVIYHPERDIDLHNQLSTRQLSIYPILSRVVLSGRM